MAPLYSYSELADMVLTYGEVNQDADAAAALYAERFPKRDHPPRHKFAKLVQRLRETGTLEKPSKSDLQNGDGASAITKETSCNPDAPLCQQIAPRLSPNQLRVRFCEWLLEQYNQNEKFMYNILITGETEFEQTVAADGNRNLRVWSRENPFVVKVWVGILNGKIIGPFITSKSMSESKYLAFLQKNIPLALEDLPLNFPHDVWYLEDVTYSQTSSRARDYLKQTFNNNFIGQGGKIVWLGGWSDLNPVHFSLWGHMRDIIYYRGIGVNMEQLRKKLTNISKKIRPEEVQSCYQSWIRRARLCIEMKGGYFNYLL